MGKHNARRTRRRAESAAAARGASAREGYQASGTLEVSPPPAWHSAPPRCRLRISVAFSSFSCLRPPKDSWRGRYMANRRSINSKTLPQWVYPEHLYSYVLVPTQIRPLYQELLGFPGELNSCHADVRSSSLSNHPRRDGVGRRFQRRRVSAASPSFPAAHSVNARSLRAETSSHQLTYSQTLATLWPGE